MNAITTKTDGEPGEGMYGPVAYAALLNNGWGRFFELGKTSLELAVEQNAEVLASYRRSLRVSGTLLFHLANQTLEDYVTIQKCLLGLAVGHPYIEAARENSHDISKAKAGITKLLLKSVDRTIAVQRSILALSAKQTTAVSEQPCVNSAPIEIVEESVQLRVDTLLAKEIVDLVVKQQPCITGVPSETDADIVQLRVDTQRAKESVDPVANPLKTTADPSVH